MYKMRRVAETHRQTLQFFKGAEVILIINTINLYVLVSCFVITA